MEENKEMLEMSEEEYIQTAEMTGNAIMDQFAKERKKWTYKINQMNHDMRDLPHLDELQNIIFMKRQDAVDYYYSLNAVVISQTKKYQEEYNKQYSNIKINGFNGIRYSSDQLINRQIETNLQSVKETIDMLKNQQEFIQETIKTIDHIIYGMTTKVKIKEMLNGLKF